MATMYPRTHPTASSGSPRGMMAPQQGGYYVASAPAYRGPAFDHPAGGRSPVRCPSFASTGSLGGSAAAAAPLPPPSMGPLQPLPPPSSGPAPSLPPTSSSGGPAVPVPPWLESHSGRSQPMAQQHLLGGGGSYGAANGPSAGAAAKGKGGGLWVPPAGRKRLNSVAILVSLVVPWALFCGVFWALSFTLHYRNPLLAYAIALAGLLVVLVCGAHAAVEARKKVAGPGKVPTWYIFFFATMLMAWVVGVVMGDANFFVNLRPFYDINNLGTYPHIDPSEFRGQQLMDAGRIVFTENTKLDHKRAMSFRNQDMYCVAPISVSHQNGTFETLQTYDFWAVGVGCCSGNNPDFHCGEFNNPSAHGGLRLMRDGERAFYRLAVQQAEAAYNIKAAHPLFFTWMQDPIAEVNAYQDAGKQFFIIGVFSYLVFQLFLVTVATIVFSKLGRI